MTTLQMQRNLDSIITSFWLMLIIAAAIGLTGSFVYLVTDKHATQRMESCDLECAGFQGVRSCHVPFAVCNDGKVQRHHGVK
jgi:hypothetical protein